MSAPKKMEEVRLELDLNVTVRSFDDGRVFMVLKEEDVYEYMDMDMREWRRFYQAMTRINQSLRDWDTRTENGKFKYYR